MAKALKEPFLSTGALLLSIHESPSLSLRDLPPPHTPTTLTNLKPLHPNHYGSPIKPCVPMDMTILEDLQHLRLTKDEEEDIQISSMNSPDLMEECTLSLFGKLLTDRQHNQCALKNTLRAAWKMGSDLRIIDLAFHVTETRQKPRGNAAGDEASGVGFTTHLHHEAQEVTSPIKPTIEEPTPMQKPISPLNISQPKGKGNLKRIAREKGKQAHGEKKAGLSRSKRPGKLVFPEELEGALPHKRMCEIHLQSMESSLAIWESAKRAFLDYKESRLSSLTSLFSACNQWTSPPPSFFKINVDDTTDAGGGNSCIGVAIRDFSGSSTGALSLVLPSCFPVETTEAYALLHGVLFALEIRVDQAIFESNALSIILALNSGAAGSDIGHILEDIREASSTFSLCSFHHLKRDGNRAAHSLAKEAKSSSQ
nr:hypothetical protein CFP56_32835 [Quercus suber]